MKKQKESPLEHEKQLRHPGQSIDDRIKKITNNLNDYWEHLSYFLGAVVLGWSIYYVPPKSKLILLIIISIFTAFYAIYIAYKTIKFRKKRASLRLGRDGEKEVAGYLDLLKKEGVHIFHGVINKKKTFDIDHIVISPHGVFTIETKTYSKPKSATVEYDGRHIIIDGYNTGNKIIKQAQRQANWLKSGLGIPVFAIIVFPGWYVKNNTKNNVAVIHAKSLKNYIEAFEQTLSIDKVNNLSEMLEKHIRKSSYD